MHVPSALFAAGKLAVIFDGLDEAGAKLEGISMYIAKGLGSSYSGRLPQSRRTDPQGRRI